MNIKIIKTLIIIAFVVLVLLVSSIVIVSCAFMKKSTKDHVATAELNLIIFQVERGIINLNTLDDKQYSELALKVCKLIDKTGSVSQREHYFRNYFSRCPDTLDEMINIIINTENNTFGWKLISWQDTAFHMIGRDGEYNFKFISADGHFEAVYNRNGEKLTMENDPINMATFNYADFVTERMKHYKYDIQPYFVWNNTKEIMEMFKRNEENKEEIQTQPIDKNEEAMRRYKFYELLLNGN
jgi:hypothetical protein